MPASIGVNLRVTGHCRQGGRKYMEDFFSVAYQQTEDEKDLEYAFFGIYDGHGGAEAAAFAKDHLMETIIKHKNFWSDQDEDVLRAIRDGYIATHYAMWREQEKWPRTASGLPSTAGTTASVAFIRRGKIYIGHVGDSGIILGYQEPGSSEWKSKPLTRDHKPENTDEMSRINSCGGKVVSKSGVPRVVWNRPKIGHKGPVRRSTPIDEIPFLAVARSLGDLWSYNYQSNRFIVSPDPDCAVLKIDTDVHRCLVFGTDGLYNMLSPSMAVHIVQQVERHNENAALSDSTYKTWLNPSKLLVERALERWHATKMRADNTSVVTLMLDPPGPPRAQVLKDRKKNLPEKGLAIMTRYCGENSSQETNDPATCDNQPPSVGEEEEESAANNQTTTAQTILETVPEPEPTPAEPLTAIPVPLAENSDADEGPVCPTVLPESTPVSSSDLTAANLPLKERNFSTKARDSTSFDPREPVPANLCPDNEKENVKSVDSSSDNTIQCNEVSSSNIEVDNEETAGERPVASSKRNLRSGRKGTGEVASKGRGNEEEEEKSKVSKRKLEEPSVSQPRKSLRIDNTKRKTEEVERKAFEAEEKLKRLALKADLARSSKTANVNHKPSLAQKILNVKNAAAKKKSCVLNKPIGKKKIQVVLKKMKKSAALKTQRVKPEMEDKKKGKAPEWSKSSENLNRRKNISRQRNIQLSKDGYKVENEVVDKSKTKNAEVQNKDVTKERKIKEPASSRERIETRKVVESDGTLLAKTTNGNRSTRNSSIITKAVTDAASLEKSTTKRVMPNIEKTFRAKALRIRLQQKTECLKKNVLRKK